jgi:hypothetical protein
MSEAIPDIIMGPNDLRTLADILHPYAVYIQHTFSSSGDGQIKAAIIYNLRARFLHMLHARDQQPILLTSYEFEIINQAFDLFLQTIPQLIPPSEERDTALRECRRMQAYFKEAVL